MVLSKEELVASLKNEVRILLHLAGKIDKSKLVITVWRPAETAAKSMNFEQAVAEIQRQSAQFDQIFSDWSETDLRSQVDMFGHKRTRGELLVNLVLSGFAAYRMQLFCYLKSCGREELNTVNLWMGTDAAFTAS
jgi:hypothetical protein